MTVNTLLSRYEKAIKATGAKPQRAAEYTIFGSPNEVLSHAMWMCSEAKGFADNAKKIRWMCCVHGIMLATGMVSIAELRRDVIALKQPKVGVYE